MNHEKKRLFKYSYTKIRNILSYIILCCFLIFLLSGCTGEAENNNNLANQTLPVSAGVENLLEIAESDSLFTADDKEIGYSDSDSVIINLSDEKIFSDSEQVSIDGSTATITSSGTYILSGTLNNGRIIIDAGSQSDVRLVLDGVNIINDSTSSIQVESANKAYITLEENTTNKLSNNFNFSQDDGANGVIYSKSEITINGRGNLEIISSGGNGIVSEKNAVLTGGTIDISSAKYGIYAMDSVRISSSILSISSKDEGIYSSNEKNDSSGFIYISDGIFEINSEGNAIDAKSILLIDGGAFNITSTSNMSIDADAKSYGFSAGEEVSLSSGEFIFNTTDDAIHSNNKISLTGGSFTITSENNGVSGGATVFIGEANLNIEKCYIGIEGYTVFIRDASININSQDDGINAYGGNDESGLINTAYTSDNNLTSGIRILSGYISINASGDGIDSNGDISISDGIILISTADNSDDMTIDYSNEFYLTGGTILAAGNISDEKDFSDLEQTVLTLNVENQPQNSFIEVLDEAGNIIISDTAIQSFSNIVLSSSQFYSGYSYTVKIGNYSTSITL